MKISLNKIAILTLTFTASMSVFAESLNCREVHTFRDSTMSINRDGAIGFNGTYINLEASWFHAGFSNLSQLTDRKSDSIFRPSAVALYLSPKGSCTLNKDSLSEDFSCSTLQNEIDITGETFKEISDGSAVIIEKTNKQLRVKVKTELNMKIQIVDLNKRNIQMLAVIENIQTGTQIKLNENMECTVQK